MDFYSNNSKGNTINTKEIVTALDSDHEPYYYIKFVLRNGSKIQWEYISKEMRDKELKEIRDMRDNSRKKSN